VATLSILSRTIIACRRCPRLVEHRERVAAERKRAFRDWEYWGRPVPGFGDPNARLVIVGLAPAAHGANRTGRMFTGDDSGNWLYEALHRFGFANHAASVSRDDGLELRDCYVTASARCAPPGNRPSSEELDACRPYLETELCLLGRVLVILTLGHVAHVQYLKAAGWWARLAPSARPPFRHGAVHHLPDATALVSSYHPSRQNTNTGRLTRSMWHGVFRTVVELLAARTEPR
jgi:uracil-DNA glycosylase family 4